MITTAAEPGRILYDDGIPVKGVIIKTASIDVRRPVEEVFDFVTDENSLPKILPKLGPIHAVTGSTIIKGPWRQAGATRTLHFDSGDTLKEQLLAFNRPFYFSYSISEFSNFAKHLTRIAYGQWWFSAMEGGTHIDWKYSFLPKNAFTRPVVSLFMNKYYEKYMNQCLHLVRQYVEID